MTEEEIRSCDNCDKIQEKIYKNGCKTCFGVVLIPFRACDMVRCCQEFDNGKKYKTDIALDEATEMLSGYAAVVNAITSGSYLRPCDECKQKSEGC